MEIQYGNSLKGINEWEKEMGLIRIRANHVLLFRKDYQIAKRIFDIIVSLIAMPFFLLLMGLIALAIYVDDPGPIFFTQKRTGKGGKRFGMYKFRTMLKNAEELKAKYAHLNEHTWPDFKITNDPRVTRVGNFLRKTSLDEIPQIINVLKGEMSLVGPRPTSFAADTYSLWHTERLEVLPGITGLWQVSGRKELDFNDRLRLDIEYIYRQSFWFDIWILVLTVGSVITRKGAE